LVNLASQSCTCESSTETSEPKKGPNANAGEWILYDDDCKKCLEEDKKRQQEMAKLAKAFEEKLKAIKGKKMECGCGWSSIKSFMQDLGTSDKNCELVIQYLTQLKTNFENKQNTIFDVAEGALYLPLQGQINIGGECLDNLEITLGKSVINPQKKQYIGDILFIDDAFNLKTENIQKTKLLEKWLFDGVKEEAVKQEKIDFAGIISSELLKKIFPNVKPDRSIELLPFINQYLKEFKMNTCEERIMFFSQIAEETDNLRLITEEKSDWGSSKSKYKGRGMFQLTGSSNYKKFGEYCNSLKDDIDFVNYPEKINNPKYAVLSAFWYWEVNNCKKYSSKLTEENMLKIAKITNCGSITSNCSHNNQEEPCYTCEPNGWERRKTEFQRLKNLFPCK
jgi:predicted chitinase